MKAAAFVLAAVFVAGAASPARAQLGGLGKIKGAADKAIDTKGKIDDMNFTDAEEKQLGEQVSLKLRDRFGVYQDEKVTKYVTLVGTVLAQASTRPTLDWKFIVLDTDGVNAYAAPGGFVHVTRGLLGLMKNEAELAGVLGHEITHITAKHTIRAIQKNKAITLTAQEAGGSAGLSDSVLSKFAGAAYKSIISNAFDRDDEVEADRVGVGLANKAGYAPQGLSDVLKRLQERNRNQDQPNGLFASHPLIKDRLENIASTITQNKLTASAHVAAR